MDKHAQYYDVIIIGGSYSGLAAAMALGRALKTVLVIDAGNPCNKQTPFSHNFLTHDGSTPTEIAAKAKYQVEKYDTVAFFRGFAAEGRKVADGYEILSTSGDVFRTGKLIIATGIKDILPDIKGFAECWGISVLHCPYCHGYEVKAQDTGILGNGDTGYDTVRLISNWADRLTLYTNGKSTLSADQEEMLMDRNIAIDEREITQLEHNKGNLQHLVFNDGTKISLNVLYAPRPFEQHCPIPKSLGCELTDEGYIRVDAMQETSVKSVFACGDNASRMRTVANAVATGTAAGMMASKKIILEQF